MLKTFGAVAGALLLTAGLAQAQTTTNPQPAPGGMVSPPMSTAPAAGTNARSGQDSDYQAVMNAKVSLLQAIDTAEGQGRGRAIEAEFDDDDGGRWEIKVIQADGKLVEHVINATTGQITRSQNQPVERFFTRLKPADVQNAPTSLKQAITIAEQRVAGAKVVEAEIDRDNDKLIYELEVRGPDRSQDIEIDATGSVLTKN